MGQELPDLDGLASLFAEAPGTRPMEPYEGMHYTDMNLYTLVPDTYTSGTRHFVSPPYMLKIWNSAKFGGAAQPDF